MIFIVKISRNFFRNIFHAALGASRAQKRAIQVAFDSIIIFITFFLAMVTRLETISFVHQSGFYEALIITLPPTIYFFSRYGLYRSFLRHASTEVAAVIALGSAASAIIMLVAQIILGFDIPSTVPIIYSAFLFIAIATARFTLRSFFHRSIGGKKINIAIYGAGAAGAQTFQSLKTNSNYRVRLVIDDNVNIQGEKLFDQRIYSFEDAKSQFKALEINTLLLAIPSASRAQRKFIITKLVDLGIEVKTIPGLSSLIDGSAEYTELTNVAIEDLLSRDPVKPDPKLMNSAIKGKVVLVTGAGGSIGSELCRQIIRWQPTRLITLDQSEYAIYLLEQELANIAASLDVPLTPIVTSTLEENFIRKILDNFEVNTIYHAAAYKHVPLMEQNVMQGIKNNVVGTMTMAKCAIEANVKDFILISTDKAVNASNFMGASKRLCELICQKHNKEQNITCFSMVRFGNVLGSSGSVIPLFKKQIENGEPITVTHEDVTRYFMTIPEAAQLVVQSGAIAKGGEIFVLDMGEPIRIIDLAKKMLRLSNRNASKSNKANVNDSEIDIIGLRPGEKLHEELAFENNLVSTIHPRILRACETEKTLSDFKVHLEKMVNAIDEADQTSLIEVCNIITPINLLSKR